MEVFKFNLSQNEENNKNVLKKCSEHLHKGELVAFPTETVYGLGANALNPEAVKKIFAAKKRPLTDPVIVHVSDFKQTESLAQFYSQKNNNDNNLIEKELFEFFGKTFWPGPLTQVVRAGEKVSPLITASTDFVGIRMPNHLVAKKLIEFSNLPIAAPSANTFGHVSPTTAQHVVDDLKNSGYPIKVIDVDIKDSCCKVGIESTVIKIQSINKNIINVVVLRRGGTSFENIKNAASLFEKKINENKNNNIKVIVEALNKKVDNNTKTGQVAPGQMIKHYAPNIPTFVLKSMENNNNNSKDRYNLKDCVVIDFGSELKWTKTQCLHYLDLSINGKISEAANSLFKFLRISEKIENAKVVLLPNIVEIFQKLNKNKKIEEVGSKAVFDRLFRSASGNYANLDLKSKVISPI